MFLDSSYFRGDLYLPLTERKSESEGIQKFLESGGENNLLWYISKYENDFLIKLLGHTLYNAFAEGMKQEPVNPIWISLKDAIYKNVESVNTSPSANYVYYWYRRRNESQYAIQGEVQGKQTFATNVSANRLLTRAWNEMTVMNKEIYCFLRRNCNEYKQYATDYCICNELIIPINDLNI